MWNCFFARAHWLQSELAFKGWRKVAASARQQQQQVVAACRASATPADMLHDNTDSLTELAANASGTTACSAAPVFGTPVSPGSVQLSQQPYTSTSSLQHTTSVQDGLDAVEAAAGTTTAADSSAGCSDDAPEDSVVPVSLADYPVGQPWRPLLQRAAIMAPRGLRRLSGLQLGRAVRDLRELEGGFIVKDRDRSGHSFCLFSVDNDTGCCVSACMYVASLAWIWGAAKPAILHVTSTSCQLLSRSQPVCTISCLCVPVCACAVVRAGC